MEITTTTQCASGHLNLNSNGKCAICYCLKHLPYKTHTHETDNKTRSFLFICGKGHKFYVTYASVAKLNKKCPCCRIENIAKFTHNKSIQVSTNSVWYSMYHYVRATCNTCGNDFCINSNQSEDPYLENDQPTYLSCRGMHYLGPEGQISVRLRRTFELAHGIKWDQFAMAPVNRFQPTAYNKILNFVVIMEREFTAEHISQLIGRAEKINAKVIIIPKKYEKTVTLTDFYNTQFKNLFPDAPLPSVKFMTDAIRMRIAYYKKRKVYFPK